MLSLRSHLTDARILLFMVKQVFLPKGRFTEARSVPNADTQRTIGGGEEAKGQIKLWKFKFFLPKKYEFYFTKQIC